MKRIILETMPWANYYFFWRGFSFYYTNHPFDAFSTPVHSSFGARCYQLLLLQITRFQSRDGQAKIMNQFYKSAIISLSIIRRHHHQCENKGNSNVQSASARQTPWAAAGAPGSFPWPGRGPAAGHRCRAARQSRYPPADRRASGPPGCSGRGCRRRCRAR